MAGLSIDEGGDEQVDTEQFLDLDGDEQVDAEKFLNLSCFSGCGGVSLPIDIVDNNCNHLLPSQTNGKKQKKRKSLAYEHWSHCYQSDSAFPDYQVPDRQEPVYECQGCVLQGNSPATGVGVINPKYWKQRHLLFSRFKEGIQLDSESFYSVTPEAIALHIAKRCQAGVVIDAFAGAGGNAIAFAQYCSMVIAIDVDPLRIEMARHNARIYGVEDRIEFIVGDFIQLAPKLKSDVVFLSPPWGGPNYSQSESFDIANDIVCNGVHIFDLARKITHNVAYFLPRNVDILQAISLAGFGNRCEVETNYHGVQAKTTTVYYGDLIAIELTAAVDL